MADYLEDKKEDKRYELEAEGHTAIIEYIKAKGKIYLTHTEVPKELGGKGIGSKIVKLALADIKKQGLTLVPMCPFVAAYIKRHPEWNQLVMKGINIE